MKTLLLDIETAPNLVYAWGLWKQNINIDHIIESGYTLCAAYKWKGTKGKPAFLRTSSVKGSILDNLRELGSLLDEADAVVHYNGKKFDIPVLNKEFLQHSLTRPSPYKQIDLYQAVRRGFRFQSNKLDFVARELGIGCKVHHKGLELWKGCMNDEEKSWKIMEKYNVQDVVLLEDLYDRLLPWIDGHPNCQLYGDIGEMSCTRCGSRDLYKRGTYKTNVGVYQRFSCNTCGAWMRGRSPLLNGEERKNVLAEAR